MNIEYKRDLQNNYMILESACEADDDGYHLRMAEQNEIPGLLTFHSGKKDGKLYLYYEITSKQSIENLYARKALNYQDILFLLNGINDTLEGLQKYLLSPEQLLFDPQFIFTYPDKSRIFLCYLPGANEYSISGLAEFILKKLNHEDEQAVALGYSFYQKSLEENFSLQQALKEILLSGEKNQPEKQNRSQLSGNLDEKQSQNPFSRNINENKNGGQSEKYYQGNNLYNKAADEYVKGREKENRWQEKSEWDEEAEYQVTHKVRKKKSRYKAAVDWVTERVHPMVILSALFLMIAVEIAFFLEWLSLTETGGIFFFVISVEILVNKFWKSQKEKKHQKWWDEEPEEEYQELWNEMYEEQDIQTEIKDNTEQTRCLVLEDSEEKIMLVCLSSQQGKLEERGKYPDILVGKKALYVGKLVGETDIIIDSPRVSRMHARLEKINGKFYVKDLNSKNGTFVNGKRLLPQEQCEIAEGDRIAFAEILYHAI